MRIRSFSYCLWVEHKRHTDKYPILEYHCFGSIFLYSDAMSSNRFDQTVSNVGVALSEALDGITQLFFHASILKAQGHPLAARYYQEWVETMRRSDNLLQAILDLDGLPVSRKPTHLDLSHDPRRILELDIALGERWVARLQSTVENCVAEGPAETAAMLRELLDVESAVLDWRRSQRDELADGGDSPAASPAIDSALNEALNEVLRAELSGITQIYYHGQLFEKWGADKLGEFMAKETWSKTWFSLELNERLLAMGGQPAEDNQGQLNIGHDIGAILDRDRELVVSQLAALTHSLELCDAARYPEMHDLLLRIVVGEQKHCDWITTQIDEIAST